MTASETATDRTAFSDEDWLRVATAPFRAAAVVSALDRVGRGRDAEERELAAYLDFLGGPAGKYGASALVREILATLEARDAPAFDGLRAVFEFRLPQYEAADEHFPEIAAAVGLVAALDADEAKSYKGFIMEGAEIVAKAVRESAVPFAGRISQKESFGIRQLRRAMEL